MGGNSGVGPSGFRKDEGWGLLPPRPCLHWPRNSLGVLPACTATAKCALPGPERKRKRKGGGGGKDPLRTLTAP